MDPPVPPRTTRRRRRSAAASPSPSPTCSTIVDEIAVADAHPLGARPFARADYVGKFRILAEGVLAPAEIERFLDERPAPAWFHRPARLTPRGDFPAVTPKGIF